MTAPYSIDTSWSDAPENARTALVQALPTLAALLGSHPASELVAVVLVDDVGLLNASLVARADLPPGGPVLPRIHGELTALVATSPELVWCVQLRRVGDELVLSEVTS